MSSGNCISCAWFMSPPEEDLVCPKHFGACLCPAFVFGATPKQYAALTTDGALVENDNGWGMYVGPKFGCVHWRLDE